MCGICGIYNFNNKPAEKSEVESMMDTMAHRGPNGSGSYVVNHIGLGHRRLSVIDLTDDGLQPYFSDCGRYVIVYNGEIYNYLELKTELQTEFTFKTFTDTEVLLNSYIKWKKECLNKLNGMFAFAIVEISTGNLFAARDRFGIKPFYYTIDKDKFIFASEIKALLKLIDDKSADNQTVYDYLLYDRVQHSDRTFFRKIKKLQHGHFLEIDNSQIQINRWYDLRNEIKEPFSNAENFLEGFSSATELCLRSDVPVGVMLSGGLDSSAITSMVLHQNTVKNLNSFSTVFTKGIREDESDFISYYDKSLKDMHFIRPDVDALLTELDDFVSCLEEPIPGLSVFAEYKLMQEARKHITVILSGQGADEYLGGYHYFFGVQFKNLLLQLKFGQLLSESSSYFLKHRSTYAFKSMLYFLLPPGWRSIVTTKNRSFLNSAFLSEHRESQEFDKLYKSTSLLDSFLNHFEHKFEHLLLWGDKTSMHHSLEMRFPFLDHRLVEHSLSLQPEQIIHRGTTKAILRKAIKGLVPEEIRKRSDKVGFEVPVNSWFANERLSELTSDVLNSRSFTERNISNPKAIRKMTKDPSKHARELWKLLSLELWYNRFVTQ